MPSHNGLTIPLGSDDAIALDHVHFDLDPQPRPCGQGKVPLLQHQPLGHNTGPRVKGSSSQGNVALGSVACRRTE